MLYTQRSVFCQTASRLNTGRENLMHLRCVEKRLRLAGVHISRGAFGA